MPVKMDHTQSVYVGRKLEHYSTLRKELIGKQEMTSTEIEYHLSTIATDLMAGERYVVYQCQRTYAAFLKSYKLKDGTDRLTDILKDGTKLNLHPLCLEICTELVSRHCQYWKLYTEHLVKPLHSYCVIFLQQIVTQSVLELNIHAQCLYCLFRIFYKFVKLIRIYNCIEAISFVQELFHDFKSVLIDILLYKDTVNLVKRQLVRFLTSIIVCDSSSINKQLYLEVISFNDLLSEQLMEVNVSNILCKNGVSGFTGQEESYDRQQVDIVHIREWSLLMIASITKMELADLQMARQLMDKLDVAVKQTLRQNRDVMLSWLPNVFSDQDDVWIQVLQILMDFSSKSFKTQTSPWIQNHWYFLQFVTYTGYDHGILIDLLTSPETDFLEYLTSYLKHLLSSWEEFKETVKDYQNHRETQIEIIEESFSTISSSCLRDDDFIPKADQTKFNLDTPVTHPDSFQECSTLPDNTMDDSYKAKQSIEIPKSENLLQTSLDQNIQEVFDNSVMDKDDENQNAPKILSGLAMISEVYSDSSGDSKENTDNEEDCLGEQDPSSDTTNNPHITGEPHQSDNDGDHVRSIISEVYSDSEGSDSEQDCLVEPDSTPNMIDRKYDIEGETLHSDNDVNQDRSIISEVYTCNNSEGSGTEEDSLVEQHPQNMIDNAQDVTEETSHQSYDNVDHVSRYISEVYTCNESEGSGNEEDSLVEPDPTPDMTDNGQDIIAETLHDSDNDVEHDSSIMDLVMSALIRVQLKLERLCEHNVINYNLRPLVSLLEQVESLYEND